MSTIGNSSHTIAESTRASKSDRSSVSVQSQNAALHPELMDALREHLRGDISNVDSAVILGSGLGGFAESIENRLEIPYEQLPGFPKSTVPGHHGSLLYGTIRSRKVIAFSGRFHRYEGYSFSQTVLPVQLSHALGVRHLIISNAAGAINTRFMVGDLILIQDLFRFFEKVAAFPSEPFRLDLMPAVHHAESIAKSIGLPVRRGTYLFAKGPTYETKAEVEAFRRVGADMVGMSTVPEILEATRLGLPVIAVSLITNMAAGVQKGKLHHDEVKVAAERKKHDFARLVSGIILSGWNPNEEAAV